MSTTGLALCRGAAIEIGHLDPIETLSDGDADFILGTLNRLLDQWNAEREAVYADVFTTVTLTAPPHTIGPTGSIVMAARPVTIEAASVVTGTSRSPIRVDRDAAWWAALPLPRTAGPPTDLYYNPTWPNGELHFTPEPSGGTLELQTRQVLTAIALATTVSLPQGYEAALLLTVAELIAAPLGIAVPGKTQQAAAEARARIFTVNRAPTPKLATWDPGMPGARGGVRNPMAGPGGSSGWMQSGWSQ